MTLRLPEAAPAGAERSIWLGIRRGLSRRCPNCGEGRLFSGFLTVSSHCEACGADNTVHPSDDFPPYLTILAAGHIVVPLMFALERGLAPALWIQAAIWLPVTLVLCLALLPVMKGGTVGLCWASGLVRQAPPGSEPPRD